MKKSLTFIYRQQAKDQLHPSRFPWDITKMLWTCCFGYFGCARLGTLKLLQSSCRKLLRLSAGKKSTSSPRLFWRYCKAMQFSHFGYFVHAWLDTPKMIVSTCRRVRCYLHAKNKLQHSLKSPAIWLAESILAHNSRTRILPDMEI